jgi:acetylornithine deacetylase
MPAQIYSAKEMLGRLVAFDTTSAKTNIPMAEFIRDYLTGHGVESFMVPAENGIHTSLFATIGPADLAGIALSGHMDVVPVTEQAWDRDPFTMAEIDGRLYGRGTCDMKGYLACVLAAVPMFKKAKLSTPIHIAFSYDEEVGCTGVRPMIGEFGTRLIKPRLVFVGEPTNMTVVDAHKGGARYRIELIGHPVHSSKAPLGVNAVTYAGELLVELNKMAADLKALPNNPRFEPPWHTLTVTQFHGGTTSNIVPGSCWIGWEIRAMPGFDLKPWEDRIKAAAARLVPQMKAISPECDIVVHQTGFVPPFGAEAGSEVVTLCQKLAGQNEVFAVPYGTEAGLFQMGGVPSVVCGPGDIAQAHTANEWIEVGELDKCMGFLERLTDWARA